MKKLTKDQLVALAEKAEKAGYNRQANVQDLKILVHPTGIHLVSQHQMVDDNGTVRCYIMALRSDYPAPLEFWLDVAIQDFNKLEEMEEV